MKYVPYVDIIVHDRLDENREKKEEKESRKQKSRKSWGKSPMS